MISNGPRYRVVLVLPVSSSSSLGSSDESAKLEVGERCIQVWAPDIGCVPYPSIITL